MIYIIITVQILFVINIWLTNKQFDDLQNQINKLKEYTINTNALNHRDYLQLNERINKLEDNKKDEK
jgi:conjugal transfer/entry exclusion protein